MEAAEASERADMEADEGAAGSDGGGSGGGGGGGSLAGSPTAQAAAQAAAAAPRRASRCEPSPCQVPGCAVLLRPGQARPYLLRYRLCGPHLACVPRAKQRAPFAPDAYSFRCSLRSAVRTKLRCPLERRAFATRCALTWRASGAFGVQEALTRRCGRHAVLAL
jgi:hypothetical protein